MQNELTCNQVISLMSFYIEDKLNTKLKEYVEDHLRHCKKCREIYMQSKKIAQHIISLTSSTYETKQYEDFKYNLSAYVDNELDENESIRIKKIAISNPLARKDLEDMYTFKRLLHNSFDKTKTESRNDYSKIIINRLQKKENPTNLFYRIIGILTAILTIAITGFAIIF